MPLEKAPGYKDLFSKNSKQYATSRPSYPKALYDFIVGLVDEKNLAWDCATGSGQAAAALADYFGQVIASDISAKQLENAQRKENVRYEIFPAEKANIDDSSVDLIAIAQAIHWFDFDRFYKEAKRVMKKPLKSKTRGGVIAAWAYGLHSVSPAVDKVTYRLYEEILGDKYWPEERKYVENRYVTIPFPFEEISAPTFQIKRMWNLAELTSYFHTWSSVQKYIDKNNADPLTEIFAELRDSWGRDESSRRIVTWPIYLRVGRLGKP